MPCFVSLNASKKTTHICILDERGKVVKEGCTESDPKAIVVFLCGERRRSARIGMEAWSLASWLHAGLVKAGLPVIVIEARHAHGMLTAKRRNKTDRNDTRSIAELMRQGAYKPVHVKTQESQKLKAQLAVRKLLITKTKDVENGIHGLFLVFGLKLEPGLNATFERHATALAKSIPEVDNLLAPLLIIRRRLVAEIASINQRLKVMAGRRRSGLQKADDRPRNRTLAALTYRAAIDDPTRFARSRSGGVHLGLTPRAGSRVRRRREADKQDGRQSRAHDSIFSRPRAILSHHPSVLVEDVGRKHRRQAGT